MLATSSVALFLSWGMVVAGIVGVELVKLQTVRIAVAHEPCWTLQGKTVGIFNTLVLLVKAKVGPDPYPVQDAQNTVFGPRPSLADWMKTVSHGKACMTGEVRGWYTFPELDRAINPYYNDNESWEVIINRIKTDVDVRQFRRVILVNHQGQVGISVGTVGQISHYPDDPNTYNIPVAYAVGAASWSRAGNVLHEFSHTLGFGEASAYACANLKSIHNTDCYLLLYGDEYNPLGTNRGYLNSYQQEKIGWMSVSEDGLLVTRTDTYTLNPIESPSGIRYLKIPVDFDERGDPATSYYLEWRKPIDYDADFPVEGRAASPYGGLLVHLGPWWDGLLLDMHPTDRQAGGGPIGDNPWDFDPNPLRVGDLPFKDPTRGIEIELKELGAESAKVFIKINRPVEQPPIVRFANLTEGQEVWGRKRIIIDAQDDRGIVSISLSEPEKHSSFFPIPWRFFGESVFVEVWNRFDWKTPNVDGEYTLLAQVRDTSNRSGEARITVKVINNSRPDLNPPKVEIIEPAPGTIITGATYIKAKVTDDVAGVDHTSGGVTFEARSVPNGQYQKTSPTYFPERDNPDVARTIWFRKFASGEYDYPPIVPDGNYQLRVTAQDRAENIGYSQAIPIGVWVSNSRVFAPGKFIRGDANGDSRVDAQDARAIADYLFLTGSDVDQCLDAADVNNDNVIDQGDLGRLTRYLAGHYEFAPVFPYPLPGTELEGGVHDPLDCIQGIRVPIFTRGDIDQDGRPTIADPIRILDYLFVGNVTSQDMTCLDSADANDDGIVNIADATYLLGYMFLEGKPAPKEPFNTCGTDPTPVDNLGCASFPLCQ